MAGASIGRDPIRVDKQQLEALSKLIRNMPEKVAGRRLLVGMRRALNKTRDQARYYAPERTGTLRRALHVVKGKKSRPESPYVVLRVNPKKSQTITTEDGRTITRTPKDYFHWVTLGTGPGTRTAKRGGFTFAAYDEDGRFIRVKKITKGATQGVDLIGDAWKNTRAQVTSEVLGQMKQAVEEYLQKNT